MQPLSSAQVLASPSRILDRQHDMTRTFVSLGIDIHIHELNHVVALVLIYIFLNLPPPPHNETNITALYHDTPAGDRTKPECLSVMSQHVSSRVPESLRPELFALIHESVACSKT